jgi:ABC-type branched-subunit amino acid transport system substrate-binding protein
MTGSGPILVGILRDHVAAGGERFARIVRLAFADVRATGRLGREIELVEEQADGLPRGSAASVEAAFRHLAARDVAAIIGPAITDNGLIVRDLADATGLPCINWTGGEQTRSDWMFHYQVGSLEEEPAFLALHLMQSGLRRIALVDDDSIVGRRYVEFFAEAATRFGITVAQQSDRGDLKTLIPRMRTGEPQAVLYLGLWDLARELAIALATSGWRPRVFANSALMYGHAMPDWRREWDGWQYVDAYADRNPVLRDVMARLGDEHGGAPVTAAAAYDMGRLVAEGIASAAEPSRAGIKAALERLKHIPAALGAAGTTMGFGRWERAALKGSYLVLREWRGGASVEVEGQASAPR